jgi:hypothetical protein
MGDEINLEQLKSRGLTCGKLKSLESKERRDAQNAYKDASKFRSFGFTESADLQEKVGKAQEDLANKLKELRNKTCALR